MTIGLLLDDTLDRPDGVQQAVILIGKELTSRGHDVHYIVSDTKRTDIRNIHSIGKSIGFKFNGNSVRTPLPIKNKSVKKLFDAVNFDIIHVQMPYSPFLSAKIIKSAPSSVKIFGTFHILPYSYISQIGNTILGYLLKSTSKRIHTSFAVSEPAKEFMKNSFGLTGEILPNPVDYLYFNSFKKQSVKKKQIVFVGRFETRKGVKELILAYSKLSKVLQNETELIMCGRGPLLDDMKKLSRELTVKVNFTGYVEDKVKAQHLANADIAVFPSISGESFGIVLTEAMSAGANITIGGNNPGYTSVLNSWPESLFDPTDIVGFSNKLESLLNNDKMRYAIGKEQQKAVKQYDVAVVVDTLLNHYKS